MLLISCSLEILLIGLLTETIWFFLLDLQRKERPRIVEVWDCYTHQHMHISSLPASCIPERVAGDVTSCAPVYETQSTTCVRAFIQQHWVILCSSLLHIYTARSRTISTTMFVRVYVPSTSLTRLQSPVILQRWAGVNACVSGSSGAVTRIVLVTLTIWTEFSAHIPCMIISTLIFFRNSSPFSF